MKLTVCTALAAMLLAQPLFADEPLTIVKAPAADSIVGTQWVKADPSGSIAGTVFPLMADGKPVGGTVQFIQHDSVQAEFKVDDRGSFKVDKVASGIYSMMYVSDHSFAAFAVHVLPSDSTKNVGSSLVIGATNLKPARALTTIARYQPVEVEGEPILESVEKLPLPATQSNPSLYRVSQSSTGGVNGRFLAAGSRGGVLSPAANTNVLIIQNENVVKQAVTAADGSFQIELLAPGRYSLLASGDQGYAAFGFELVGEDELARSAVAGNAQLVASAMQPPAGGIDGTLAPPSSAIPTQLPPPPSQDDDGGLAMGFEPGAGGGGFGGGGFGGGGFGGGGGGIGGGGGFLGLAAVGGIIAAVVASDDDSPVVPAPASPAIP